MLRTLRILSLWVSLSISPMECRSVSKRSAPRRYKYPEAVP